MLEQGRITGLQYIDPAESFGMEDQFFKGYKRNQNSTKCENERKFSSLTSSIVHFRCMSNGLFVFDRVALCGKISGLKTIPRTVIYSHRPEQQPKHRYFIEEHICRTIKEHKILVTQCSVPTEIFSVTKNLKKLDHTIVFESFSIQIAVASLLRNTN